MNKAQTWSSIKKNFPDEWVAIANASGDSASPYGEIVGELLAHNKDEAAFTEELKQKCVQNMPVDIRYTGDILPDNPVDPILWQITDTNS